MDQPLQLRRPSRPWLAGTTTLALGIGLAVLVHRGGTAPRPVVSPAQNPDASPSSITALGRLEPVGEVITVAPPAASPGGAPARLRQLRVEEGDRVESGSVIAVLDSQPRLEAAVQESAAQLRLAEARLAVAAADQRREELVQQARVERLEAEFRTARLEEKRHQTLFVNGAVSASLRDAKRLDRERVGAQLAEARAMLRRSQASAGVPGAGGLDVAAARRQRDQAGAALVRVLAEREDSLVRAPISGRILSVLRRPGEALDSEGLVQMGRTEAMQVVAEVYQSDVARVRLGALVAVTSPALSQPLQGRVSRIGTLVKRQALINTDPSANNDSRVVEVRALLSPASSRLAASLTNLQVTARIER
ncbi:HlyD family efflux transporter periplasmic adaptor subunit [Cyanobium gracile]|uniref:ABC exporter membrane fusion protein, DevB family n=1 Tax=Cyanobium gracile (strain ATCC 27147 / PCC 6307) TaxID=292564 RepID=K9P5V9_CYAGP|nr:HlyD family efflux transporter periplasmic adaptor subunit [Cyanobium gracile]AFY28505.1 ABC exporter membrane fusion protein, DevB family [Cyanobium gracile PCC 6307]